MSIADGASAQSPAEAHAPHLSVIVFAYNEEKNVEPVVEELLAWMRTKPFASEVIFVDDGSTDGTFAEARRVLAGHPHAIVRHERNLGIGAAIKSGVRVARGEWVTFTPADGQISAQSFSEHLAQTTDGAVDLVLSVYDHRDDGLYRKVLSAGVRALITVVHGVRVRNEGPYLFRRTLLDPGQLAPDSFFLNFEFPIRVMKAGLRVRTVTITCRPRVSGASKSAGLGRIRQVFVDLVGMRTRETREWMRRNRL